MSVAISPICPVTWDFQSTCQLLTSYSIDRQVNLFPFGGIAKQYTLQICYILMQCWKYWEIRHCQKLRFQSFYLSDYRVFTPSVMVLVFHNLMKNKTTFSPEIFGYYAGFLTFWQANLHRFYDRLMFWQDCIMSIIVL